MRREISPATSHGVIIPVTILSNRGTSPGVNGRRRTRVGSGASSAATLREYRTGKRAGAATEHGRRKLAGGDP
jgi:hypothetical protein